MFCTFLADRIFDGIFHCLKLFLGQLAKALDVFDFLNLSQSSLALAAALVVFGVAKAAFLVAAGDDNSCAFQFNRCVLIFQIAGVKKDRTVLFAHGDGELIHDTAVDAVVVVLGELAVQSDVDHGDGVVAEHVTQHYAGYGLNGCGRGKAGAVRNVSVEHDIEALLYREALLAKCPHHSLRICGPVAFFSHQEFIERRFYHAEFFKVHRVKTKLSVVTFSCCHVGSDGQCAWKYVASVVIGVLTDQVYTSRCEVGADVALSPEQFCKTIQYLLFHFVVSFSFWCVVFMVSFCVLCVYCVFVCLCVFSYLLKYHYSEPYAHLQQQYWGKR